MPVEFTSLYVSGYRRLRNVGLSLGPFNVLVGANGVGKSSILEVFDLLSASASGDLEYTISQSGGISSLVTQDGSTDSICFELEKLIKSEPFSKYSLRLSIRGTGFAISSETLLQGRLDNEAPFQVIEANDTRIRYLDTKKKLPRPVFPNWEQKPQETALYQVPKMFKEPEAFRHLLASASIYHILDVTLRAPVRLPQPLQPADTPGKNGETLLSCLYALRENEPSRFESVIDALRAAFPTFEKLDLPLVAAGQITLRWKDRNFKNPLYPHQLSEGTLRFLWLATLLQSPGLPKVTLIDEPEVSLHPEMLQLLTELMREASSRTQLIVATHSDRFVRFLKPEELVVCDLDEEGGTSVKRADELDLDKWLSDYALDELWSMGRLGGRS
ncbi:MAG: AAA family ATPase [Aliidongia sp.]